MKEFFDKLNWVTVLGVVVAVEMQIGSGSMSLVHMIPDAWIPTVQAWMSNLGSIGALIMSAGAFGRVPGVASAGQSPITPTIVKILIAAFLLSMFLFVDPASAQTKLKSPQEIGADIKTALTPKPAPSIAEEAQDPFGKAVSSFRTEVQKIKKEVVDFAIADANAAIKDATNHNDVISLPCWQANLKMFQGLPIMWDQPPAEPIGVMLGVQISRDIINSITGNDKDSLKVACAALWGDQLKILANVGTMLGIRIASGGIF